MFCVVGQIFLFFFILSVWARLPLLGEKASPPLACPPVFIGSKMKAVKQHREFKVPVAATGGGNADKRPEVFSKLVYVTGRVQL